MYQIERFPVPGSPRVGYYVTSTTNPEFERGPFDFIDEAEEVRADLIERYAATTPTPKETNR